jgi:hypothetical protein
MTAHIVSLKIEVTPGVLDDCRTRYFACAHAGGAVHHRRYGASASEAEAKAFAAAIEYVGKEARRTLGLPRVVAPYDQPLPVESDGDPLWPEAIDFAEYVGCPESVIADMRARDLIGRERYGMPLRRGDGRDHMADAYQELLDAFVYLTSVDFEVDRQIRIDVLDAIIEVKRVMTGRGK